MSGAAGTARALAASGSSRFSSSRSLGRSSSRAEEATPPSPPTVESDDTAVAANNAYNNAQNNTNNNNINNHQNDAANNGRGYLNDEDAGTPAVAHVHTDEDEDEDEDDRHLRMRAASYPAGSDSLQYESPSEGTGAVSGSIGARAASPRGNHNHWHVVIKARTRLHSSSRVTRKVLYYDAKPGSTFTVGRAPASSSTRGGHCDLLLDDDRCAELNAIIAPININGISGIRLTPKARMYELVEPARRGASETTIQVGSVIKVGSVSLEVINMCTNENDDFVERFAVEISNSNSNGRGSVRSIQDHSAKANDSDKAAKDPNAAKTDADSDGSVEGGTSHEEADADIDGRRATLDEHEVESDVDIDDHQHAEDDDDDDAMCYICWGGPDSSLVSDDEEESNVESPKNNNLPLAQDLENKSRRPDGKRANPLIRNPCGKCSGSSRYVHLNCLLTWIKSSGSGHCSICNGPLPQHFSSPPPNIELKVVRHRRGQSWIGTRRFRLSFADRNEASIGRDSDADVCLGDRSVGSIHARLRFDHESREFKLSDCNSLGGTYLQVKEAIDLVPETPVHLKIGRTALTLRMTEKRQNRIPMLPMNFVGWNKR